MNAAHIMTTGVVTLQKEKTVKDAMKILIEKRIRQMPVVDNDNRIIGVLKARKLIQSVLPRYVADGLLKDVRFAPDLPNLHEKAKELAGKNISDVMDKDFVKIPPDAAVFEIAAIFVNAEKSVENIYVVDDKDRILGIISPWDMFKKIWDLNEK